MPLPQTPSGVPGTDTGIALGLGLTNECNLACAFCYRDPTRTDRLSLDQVKSVMQCLHVRSVNLGTGANTTGQAHHHFQRPQHRCFRRQRIARLPRCRVLSRLPERSRTGRTALTWQLGAHSRAGGALCKDGRARNLHRRHDEVELLASAGGGTSRETV